MTVPKSCVVEVIVPADFARVWVLSLHGGPNTWKRFPFEERNESPILDRVEIFESLNRADRRCDANVGGHSLEVCCESNLELLHLEGG
jgi:hypothetical protein